MVHCMLGLSKRDRKRNTWVRFPYDKGSSYSGESEDIKMSMGDLRS